MPDLLIVVFFGVVGAVVILLAVVSFAFGLGDKPPFDDVRPGHSSPDRSER